MTRAEAIRMIERHQRGLFAWMDNPGPLEGAWLYAAAAFLVGGGMCLKGLVLELVPLYFVGVGFIGYCVLRMLWCLRKAAAG